MPELQGFPALFQAQNPNVRIPGYLFSMKMEQAGTRRKVNPERIYEIMSEEKANQKEQVCIEVS